MSISIISHKMWLDAAKHGKGHSIVSVKAARHRKLLNVALTLPVTVWMTLGNLNFDFPTHKTR